MPVPSRTRPFTPSGIRGVATGPTLSRATAPSTPRAAGGGGPEDGRPKALERVECRRVGLHHPPSGVDSTGEGYLHPISRLVDGERQSVRDILRSVGIIGICEPHRAGEDDGCPVSTLGTEHEIREPRRFLTVSVPGVTTTASAPRSIADLIAADVACMSPREKSQEGFDVTSTISSN